MLRYCYKIQFRWIRQFHPFLLQVPPPLDTPPSSTSTIEYLNNLIEIPSFPVARTTKEFFSEEIRFHEILCDQDLVGSQHNKNPATTVNAIIGTDCVAYLNTKPQFPFMDFSLDTPPRQTSIMEYPTEFPSGLVGMMMKYNSYEKKK